ncbi:katanin p60 ATPase-containing subunit [Magnaporthiopsis poae ATCC 64411]|uniref:Katanin p60 ATPase-containing subunit n=1 Tax=Magnaporthiopsis poae (strain ATCC 64411 / 73-15) TaxID=644358 RepID=A0A0C4DLM5_MAGP6|nr:katanin p60 ATPase-containing subunit [Magnaporthiopsis poae ATCC 64411]
MLLAGRRFAASSARCRPLLSRQRRPWARQHLYSSSDAAPSPQPSHEPHHALPAGPGPATSPPDSSASPPSASTVASTATSPRSRSARAARAVGSGYPPVELPQWFLDREVTLLHECHHYPKLGDYHLYKGEAGARECFLDSLLWNLDEIGWSPDSVAKTREAIDRVAKGFKVEANSANIETLISLHHQAVFLAAEAVAVVAYQVHNGALQPLESYVPPPLPFMRPSPLTRDRLRFAEQQARASSRSLVSDSVLSLSLEFGMADAFGKECVAFAESIHGQLRAATVSKSKPRPRQRHSPGTAEARAGRPIPVLAVMNYSSQAIARAMVERAASHLRADVIHLDTHTLAHITGGVLGQDLYSHKGPFSLMGYRVDELSGRLSPRITPQPETTSSPESPDSQSNADAGSGGALYTVSPNQLRTMLLGSEQGTSSPARVADWDDLKLGNALEQILNAADVKQAPLPESECPGPPDGGPRRLIVHVQDIAELTELGEGSLILSKLRAAVDRLADGGKPIILVGSTTHVVNKAWYKQLSNLVDNVNCHIHPFDCPPPHHPKSATLLGRRAVGHRNLSNLTSMLEAMLGQEVSIPLGVMASKVLEYLDRECLDLQWAHNFASALVAELPKSFSTAGPVQLPAKYLLRGLRWSLKDHRNWEKKPGYVETSPYPWPSVLAGRVSSSVSGSKTTSADGDGDGMREASSKSNNTTEYGSSSSSSNGNSSSNRSSSSIKSRIENIKLDENERQLLHCIIEPEKIKTTWDSVVCSAETKESLQALTSLVLTRPSEFSYGVLASERMAGCLLYGPPGTGKTLMGKAIAKEGGAAMLEISAAAINDRWVGASERNVRAVFTLARKLAPVVVFLDEADSLLGTREGRFRSGHREVINQFLREWDGLSETDAFIIVASNRPHDLDEAVLRRLPRKILVDLPLASNRLDMLRIMLRDEQLDPVTVSLERLAADTELYSGSDLKHLCVAAAFQAVRDTIKARDASPSPADFVFPDRRTLTGDHFARAMDEVSASVSPDTGLLKAIRKFDERFGDGQRKRKKAAAMGFAVAPYTHRAETARVRHELSNNA